jgi:acyl-coenzyme A synthetase/AMP-(fatty) acid ligase/acyl carrier protein
MIAHGAAMNTVQDVNRRFGITGDDVVFALSSLSFDLSVYDIFGVLGAGGCLVLPDHAQELDPAHWLRLIADHRVTVWNSVPALLRIALQWVEPGSLGDLASLRVVMLSGDWIPLSLPEDIRRRSPEAQIIAMGGATEASIWSNFHHVNGILPGWPSIPYGRPLANQRFYVMDEAMQPRPTWVPGELYIGGFGVAEGYLGDRQRTSEKFVHHPTTGERLYRTGDWGRYRPGGDLQFLGREDLQVKVNGNRIELGEIETILLGHHEIKEAVVTAPLVNGDRRLAAYVVCAAASGQVDTVYVDREGTAAPDPERIRQYLRRQLPPYMVPTNVMILASLPLSSNGKVDRNKLRPSDPASAAGDASAVPLDETERKLADVWSTALRLDWSQIGADSNFFVLGGDSVLAMRIIATLANDIGAVLDIRDVFDSPTLRELAKVLRQRQAAGPVTDDGDWVVEEL